MWSRPIRMPEANNWPRLRCGPAARTSHTDDACVIVTSFSTPSPAITRPQVRMSGKSRSPSRLVSARLSSLEMPLNRAIDTPSAPRPVVTNRLNQVPTNADVVRHDTPWAR